MGAGDALVAHIRGAVEKRLRELGLELKVSVSEHGIYIDTEDHELRIEVEIQISTYEPAVIEPE